eukprot:evm.model.scf_1353EXC.4 EVM.evm.TU.scf_1353EXC.4   scf_1353EXC:6349-9433(+)
MPRNYLLPFSERLRAGPRCLARSLSGRPARPAPRPGAWALDLPPPPGPPGPFPGPPSPLAGAPGRTIADCIDLIWSLPKDAGAGISRAAHRAVVKALEGGMSGGRFLDAEELWDRFASRVESRARGPGLRGVRGANHRATYPQAMLLSGIKGMMLNLSRAVSRTGGVIDWDSLHEALVARLGDFVSKRMGRCASELCEAEISRALQWITGPGAEAAGASRRCRGHEAAKEGCRVGRL